VSFYNALLVRVPLVGAAQSRIDKELGPRRDFLSAR
jgi:hypothetical protein